MTEASASFAGNLTDQPEVRYTARPIRAALVRPLPARPHVAGSVVRGRPGRSGPARPGPGGGADRGRPRAQVPWGKVVVDGVPVVPARRLPSMLRQLPAVLGPERAAAVASQARIRFRAVA